MAVDRLAVDRPRQEQRTPVRDDLVERLDASVRERVRREGVDPQREALVVRRIAEDVVRDHDQRGPTARATVVSEVAGWTVVVCGSVRFVSLLRLLRHV